MSVVLLRGREAVELGAIGEGGSGGVAAAISRGGAPKPYDHVDPNEDAALAMQGPHGVLVAVADGHWGHRGAECALEALQEAAAEWIEGPRRGAEVWRRLALEMLITANRAVVAGQPSGTERARTTLSFALARPDDDVLVSAALGDSHLFVVDSILATEIPRPRKTLFLGTAGMREADAEAAAQIGVQALDRPLALVAATDGLSERAIGVADPAGAVYAAVATARLATPGRRALDAARGVVEAALAAHRANEAGDNVAAAVAWLPEPTLRSLR